MKRESRFGPLAGLFLAVLAATHFFIQNIYLDYLLTALVIISFILAIYVKEKEKPPKINLAEFTFVNPPGCFTHPKYSFPICPACLNKTKSISPVANGYCTVCKEPISETLESGGSVFTVSD